MDALSAAAGGNVGGVVRERVGEALDRLGGMVETTEQRQETRRAALAEWSAAVKET